jgi:integrase
MIARRSETTHPRFITISLLTEIGNHYEWSADHRKGIRTSLISFFDWAMANGIVADNPAALLPSVSGSPPNPRPAPDEIWEALLAAAPPRELMMARLAGEAGMRRAEVAVCHRDDLFRDGLHWSLRIHGKGGKERILPVTDSLAGAIIEFCPAGYLFPSTDRWGHLLAPHLAEHQVGKLMSALMPPGWSMHKLRHRFASRGLAGTNDLIAVAEALGHESTVTTQRYVKITREKVRAVSEAAAPSKPPLGIA